MVNIYFDESGYTGRALLDPQQPYFVIASSTIGDPEAELILNSVFPDYKGVEFKLQRIWNKPKYQSGILQFADMAGKRSTDIYAWIVDKKFCVLQKMIDFLIEPHLHESGYDFYANSFASKYANTIYFLLNEEGSSDLYDATVLSYFKFANNPSEESLSKLCYCLEIMRNSTSHDLAIYFEQALYGALSFNKYHRMEKFRDTLEIYLTSMLSSVAHWSTHIDGELHLFHDDSNAFFKQRQIWDAITSQDVPTQFHPVANGPPIPFPLPVRSTTAVDSKRSPAVQLCDLLAGMLAKIMNATTAESDQKLARMLLNTDIKEMTQNGLAPGKNFLDAPPTTLSGADAVDQMIAIIQAGGDCLDNS